VLNLCGCLFKGLRLSMGVGNFFVGVGSGFCLCFGFCFRFCMVFLFAFVFGLGHFLCC